MKFYRWCWIFSVFSIFLLWWFHKQAVREDVVRRRYVDLSFGKRK